MARVFKVDLLRKLLKERGVSQRWLASEVGITQPGINKVVTGKTSCRLQTYLRICDALDVPLTYFIEREVQREAEKTCKG